MQRTLLKHGFVGLTFLFQSTFSFALASAGLQIILFPLRERHGRLLHPLVKLVQTRPSNEKTAVLLRVKPLISHHTKLPLKPNFASEVIQPALEPAPLAQNRLVSQFHSRAACSKINVQRKQAV